MGHARAGASGLRTGHAEAEEGHEEVEERRKITRAGTLEDTLDITCKVTRMQATAAARLHCPPSEIGQRSC